MSVRVSVVPRIKKTKCTIQRTAFTFLHLADSHVLEPLHPDSKSMTMICYDLSPCPPPDLLIALLSPGGAMLWKALFFVFLLIRFTFSAHLVLVLRSVLIPLLLRYKISYCCFPFSVFT